MAADRRHLHHRLLDIGLTQRQVAAVFYVLAGAFGLVAYVVTALDQGKVLTGGLFKLFALGALVLIMIALLVFLSRRSLDRVGYRD